MLMVERITLSAMKRYITGGTLLLTLLVTRSLSGQVDIDSRIVAQMKSAGPDDLIECIVYLHQISPDTRNLQGKVMKSRSVYHQLRQHADQSQQALIRWCNQHNKSWSSRWIVNAIHVSLTAQEIDEIILFPEVEKVLPNPQWRLQPTPAEWNVSQVEVRGPTAIPWGIHRIKADSLWDLGIKGKGVTVGGEDTGYDWSHPAIKNQYRGYRTTGDPVHDYNWHDAIHTINPLNKDEMPTPESNPCGLDSQVPCDDQSHGTHTMGTMAGLAPDEPIGIAPEAEWIGCRCMERGWGSPWTYLECFEWLLAPTDLTGENPNPDLAPAVINNSWGCPPEEGCNATNFSLLDEAVAQLRQAGIFVVVSAGNDGTNCSTVNDPAAIYASSFTIGAIRQDDTLAGFSSRGPVLVDGSGRLKPDLVAPGVNVRSAVLGGGYQNWNGTSMSGPHVAGGVALLLSAVPALDGDVDRIQYILESSADPMYDPTACGPFDGMSVPNAYYGYGILNLSKALKLALATTGNGGTIVSDWAIQVVPNPAHDKINLNWSQKINVHQIRMYDQLGRLVLSASIDRQSNWSNDLQGISAGLYYLQLVAEEGSRTIKLLKD